jgi:hypothetical protein
MYPIDLSHGLLKIKNSKSKSRLRSYIFSGIYPNINKLLVVDRPFLKPRRRFLTCLIHASLSCADSSATKSRMQEARTGGRF